jgi:uncharacterized membrane protein
MTVCQIVMMMMIIIIIIIITFVHQYHTVTAYMFCGNKSPQALDLGII